tara:strand:- start:18352 stop:19212 length:861 start_codon:yes stop_codon:yes gene_type:complete
MYGEVSFVISLGLILILILTHFDFKSKLFNFENELKTNEKTFQDKIDKMRGKVQGNYKKFVGPIDCSGEWKCNDKCIKTFIVDTYPRYGGNACPTGSDSAPTSGPGSEECVPGIHCPIDQDCEWQWSACGSNCEREIDIITQSSGNGKPCPINRVEAQNEMEIPLCLDDIGGGQQQCVPSDCEGYWGSCGSSCEQSWIKTKDAVPLSKECELLGETRECTGDYCENKDCEWYWAPCIGNQRQRVKDSSSGEYRRIIITGLPQGNGSSCPTIASETDPFQFPTMPSC